MHVVSFLLCEISALILGMGNLQRIHFQSNLYIKIIDDKTLGPSGNFLWLMAKYIVDFRRFFEYHSLPIYPTQY